MINLDGLNIVRPIKSDKTSHVSIIIYFSFLEKQPKMGRRDDKFNIFTIAPLAPVGICPEWSSKIISLVDIT